MTSSTHKCLGCGYIGECDFYQDTDSHYCKSYGVGKGPSTDGGCGNYAEHQFIQTDYDGDMFHECKDCHYRTSHNWNEGKCTICDKECSHSWISEGDLMSSGGCHKCERCGLTEEHQWEDGVCKVCGEVCSHQFQPTDDEEQHKCYICGLEQYHNWEYSENYRYCRDCGQMIENSTTGPY